MSFIRVGRVQIPESEVRLRAARAGGPGGQGVNTTSSKVELRWDVGGSQVLSEAQRRRVLHRLAGRITLDGELVLTGSEHRSQHLNRQAVLARFRTLVGEALEPPPVRQPTRPGSAARRRRLEDKRRRGETKRLRRRPRPGPGE